MKNITWCALTVSGSDVETKTGRFFSIPGGVLRFGFRQNIREDDVVIGLRSGQKVPSGEKKLYRNCIFWRIFSFRYIITPKIVSTKSYKKQSL